MVNTTAEILKELSHASFHDYILMQFCGIFALLCINYLCMFCSQKHELKIYVKFSFTMLSSTISNLER